MPKRYYLWSKLTHNSSIMKILILSHLKQGDINESSSLFYTSIEVESYSKELPVCLYVF